MLQVHPASVQDRDGAIPLLQASRPLFPFIERVFADSAYAAERVANATRIIVEIVRKQAGQIGFAVHPRRWVVERFFAWLGRNRRLAKDFEGTIASATAFLYAASVLLLTRRLLVRFDVESNSQVQPQLVMEHQPSCSWTNWIRRSVRHLLISAVAVSGIDWASAFALIIFVNCLRLAQCARHFVDACHERRRDHSCRLCRITLAVAIGKFGHLPD